MVQHCQYHSSNSMPLINTTLYHVHSNLSTLSRGRDNKKKDP